MKKKIFFAVATIVAAVSVGYAAYLKQKVEIGDALLENIEALADDENGDAPSGCFATICDRTCERNGKTYKYESKYDCMCDLCTGEID